MTSSRSGSWPRRNWSAARPATTRARRSRGPCWRTAPAPWSAPVRQEAQVTAGDLGQTAAAPRHQPLTALDRPGGDTITAAPEQTRPTTGDQVVDGPFTTRQLLRLDEALRVADQQTGLTFSVFIGEL